MTSSSSPARELLGRLRPFRGRIALATVMHVVKNTAFWVIPLSTAAVIDAVSMHASVTTLVVPLGAGLGALLLAAPGNTLYSRLYGTVYRSVGASLRMSLSEKLQVLSIGAHARRTAASLQSKVVRDVEGVELMLQQVASAALVGLEIVVSAIVITALQVPVFLVVFVLVVPVAVLILAVTRRESTRQSENFRHSLERLAGSVGEMSSLMPITRAHALEQSALDRMRERSTQVLEAGLRLDRVNARFETTSWISFQSLSLTCLACAGAFALLGVLPISAGQIVLLSTFFGSLTGSVLAVVNLAPAARQAMASLRSIHEVLQDPDVERNDGKPVLERIDGVVQFSGVTFQYPHAAGEAISGLDLTLRPGEVVALVGASGSGKSTVMNLLLGFIRPTRGEILFDGHPMSDIDMRSVRRRISVVPQDSVLLQGTVRENVTFGMPAVADDGVRAALDAANATEFVDALPEGMNTMLGPGGVALSGGQRQRVAIARAAVRDPRILLLDEATSALDNASEAHVTAALRELMRGRTALVIAHRLTTIRAADRIVVMEHGRVVESGSHDELLEIRGRYAELVRVLPGGKGR